MKATIYLPKDKSELYAKAKEKLGSSISATFVRCLERELEAQRLETDRIVVELYDAENERFHKKAFEGRWLIGFQNTGEVHTGNDAQTGKRYKGCYAVAQTAKGKIVVVSHDLATGDARELDVFETFNDLKNAEPSFPDSLVAAVASELDVDHVEILDI